MAVVIERAPVPKRQKRVLTSVFPPSAVASIQPTPVATPVTGFTAPDQTFGGPHTPTPSNPLGEASSRDSADQQIEWNRAWHVVTQFLLQPDEQIGPSLGAEISQTKVRQFWMPECSLEVFEEDRKSVV